MNWLAENALMIWMGGAVALTLAIVIYSQVRSLGALLGVVAVAAVTAALLLVEHFLETPREAVERTLYELADRVEANDIEGTLHYVVPASNPMRTDVKTLMPEVVIEQANVMGTPEITVDMSQSPPEATVRCRGFLQATIKNSGMKGGDMAELTITFVRQGDRWLVKDYKTHRDFRRDIGRR